LQLPYTIYPLGDAAATISLGNIIDEHLNDKIIAMQQWMLLQSFHGQRDIIVAYSSLTVLYDPVLIKQQYQPASSIFEWVAAKLTEAFEKSTVQPQTPQQVIRIPVCYAPVFAPDLATMADEKNLSAQELVNLHCAHVYRVFTIGFLPGFSYMATLPAALVKPRKPKPVQVMAGSVGIAGAQTGIYPLDSPGGWHIIGRTPLPQFNARGEQLVRLRVGDRVQFYAVSEEEFYVLAAQEQGHITQ